MKKKVLSLLYLLAVYVLAFAVGIVVSITLMQKASWSVLLSLLLGDAVATVIVYIFGVIRKSPSLYDPYWSVQTIIFYVFLLIYFNRWNAGTILVLAALTFYSARLTANFIVGFDSLSYVDWRYKMLKQKSGRAFQLVNFFGINMMPTLLVYLASIPFFLYAMHGEFKAIDILALALMCGAVGVEMVADLQMKSFAKGRKSREEVFQGGLWKYSRHPNYLGEISFWCAGAFLLLNAMDPWYWVSGGLAMVLLFLFISIPMIEKNFASYKPTYVDYRKTTSMLLLLPRRKK